MDLKRKRDEGSDDFDTLQFTMHARHTWLAQNTSTLKLPWDFKMCDQFDLVQKSCSNVMQTVGAMPPLPAVEGPADTSPDTQIYGRADPSFGTRALCS